MDEQQKYMHFQMLQQHIEQVSEHLQLMNQQMEEAELSKEALEELTKVKLEEEILSPIANGIFIKSKLLDNSKLLVNVGAGTTIEKPVSEVIKMIDEQKGKIMGKLIEGEMMLQELQQQAMKIFEEENVRQTEGEA